MSWSPRFLPTAITLRMTCVLHAHAHAHDMCTCTCAAKRLRCYAYAPLRSCSTLTRAGNMSTRASTVGIRTARAPFPSRSSLTPCAHRRVPPPAPPAPLPLRRCACRPSTAPTPSRRATSRTCSRDNTRRPFRARLGTDPVSWIPSPTSAPLRPPPHPLAVTQPPPLNPSPNLALPPPPVPPPRSSHRTPRPPRPPRAPRPRRAPRPPPPLMPRRLGECACLSACGKAEG